MANQITILGKVFNSQADAEKYFYDIRDKLWRDQETIIQGAEFDMLHNLYKQYCESTDWPIPGDVVSFRVKNIARGSGSAGGTSQGFAVMFSTGKESEFSARTAIKDIVKHNKI
ncbi:hypothetical protein [Rheinheimera soli]|uniref:hypothetical protein n=1 Tax=Rheinheimera soli TaxID=443616 RepID=UPI001E55E825|nr:hypothetical protein [Rheinheimera soli]